MSKHQATPDLDAKDIALPATIRRNEETVRNGFWPKLQKFLSRVPFAEKAVAAYYCAFDPDTPLKAKGILLAALAYFIMPVDVLPDVLLGLGFTDDLTVLATAYGLIRSHIKPEHIERARQTLDQMRNGGEPPSA
jgi:uncharacterized membrane protein YkvA (DUF1232 family)